MFNGKDVTIINANAGSGKTTKLLELLSEQLGWYRPEEIAFVTFSRKGVEEGIERVVKQFNIPKKKLVYFKTIHSLAFKALFPAGSEGKYKIFGSREERKFNELTGYLLNRTIAKSNLHLTEDSKILNYYDLERGGGLTSAMEAEFNFNRGYMSSLVNAYDNYKSSHCLVDFYDCLIKYEQEGTSLPCKVVFIDEFQDISLLQLKVILKAFSGAVKFFIAGDTEQSIFGYNGSRPDILIELCKKFPVIELKQSYRISKAVYRVASAVMTMIDEKTDKAFDCREEAKEGSVEIIDRAERLLNMLPRDNVKGGKSWYLLGRNNYSINRYKSILEQNAICYWTKDGFCVTPKELHLLQQYEQFKLVGYKDEEAKLRFMGTYGIVDFDNSWEYSSLFNEGRKLIIKGYIEKYGLSGLIEESKKDKNIIVSTIHSVKGGEADNVALLLDVTGKTNKALYEDLDAELRLLYVAITRAKENLFFIDSEKESVLKTILATAKSEFGLDF